MRGSVAVPGKLVHDGDRDRAGVVQELPARRRGPAGWPRDRRLHTVRSTYRGGYLDLPADGQPMRETGILILRIVDGRVAESWFEGNDLEVAQQLGGRISPR